MHKNQFSFLFFVLNARHRSWWLIDFMTDVEEREKMVSTKRKSKSINSILMLGK